ARIVFQGAEGAYSQMAMQTFFGKQINDFHVDTFRDAMCAIEEGSADFAVLPIENSTAGIVNEIYDLLVEFENYIVGEQVIKIEHCLMGLPGTKPEQIQTVYSHPQSLMQSSRYLNDHPAWRQISMQNNAFAARKVKEDGIVGQAAIASRHAAEVYGLEVLESGVNQSQTNATRFIIVTNQKIFLKNANKVSICFEVPHESGSLYHMLSHFIYNNLNMSKIESRPLEDRNWEYRFFIDFEGNLADSAVKNALRGLRDEARNMRILGNYESRV
ncbi:MAG: prephenate dehydratase, partial [Muribaculaceae bacterium]|nr:prephenate dehydratase [Muribaculaceae bacterium]